MAFETPRLKRPRPWAWDRWALAAVPLLFLAVVLVAPAVRLMLEGGSADLWAPWQDPYLRGRLLWSLAQAAMTCGLVLLIGLPMGWVLARLDFPGRGLLLRGLMLPFVVPTLVAAMGVLALMGPRGLLAQWGGPDLQGTPWLLLFGNLFFNLCVLVRAAVDALSQVSAARVAAARSLGATPWRAFWRVEWPAIAPWLASALCLVFLYCFSGFGLALVLGKFVGIMGTSGVLVLVGLGQLPEGMRWPHMAAASLLAGIGFTMSLFIGGLAFAEGDAMNAVRFGVLVASVVAATAGLLVLRNLSGKVDRGAL